ICYEMLLRGDYLHPYLLGAPYYQKPLLSYWIILLLSYVTGGLNEWALRLPSALAGVVTIACIWRLGCLLMSRQVGLLAGWMSVTTVFVIFWARVASTDMLNVAGVLLALVWYFEHRGSTKFVHYAVFFIILAVTSLTKGLTGAVMPVVVLLPELVREGQWKRHINPRLVLALLPALVVYLSPFLASSLADSQNYGQSGLYRVFVENFVRFFQPFDHQRPIYTYLIYLPAYLMPWTFFFIPAVWYSFRNRSDLTPGASWAAWATFLLFALLTASGSRRSYYVLPAIPFAILFTADWIVRAGLQNRRVRWAGYTTLASYVLLFAWFGGLQPYLKSNSHMVQFARDVRKQSAAVRPWSEMPVLMVRAPEKIAYYLHPGRPPKKAYPADLPVVLRDQPCQLVVSRIKNQSDVEPFLNGYKLVTEPLGLDYRLLGKKDTGKIIVFIPPRHLCGA
ncbi:MAG: dolichyl-phosphate-mannose--protein mannosyltransferase, partial [Deltaproteobacteria bacterium]|nr:dolichyl-phosphate-mannose--protein mannosyltransferase [Deltaproteobacteria bacterium]